MVTYIAKGPGKQFQGGLTDCLVWSQTLVASEQAKVVKIFRSRAGEPHARVILEITENGFRLVKAGRIATVKKLLRNG